MFPNLLDCVAGYLILTAVLVTAVTYKYRSLFHPLLFSALQLGVMAGLAPWAQGAANSMQFPQDWWIRASLLTSLYLFGMSWPLLVPWNPLRAPLEWLLAPCETQRHQRELGLQRLYSLCLLLLGLCAFGLLIRDSSAGWLWIFDPRMAYMEGRAGTGHWYVLSQTLLFLSYLHWLWYQRPKELLTILCATLTCLFAMKYFGSKAGMVGVLMAGGVYYNFFVREFSRSELGLAAALGIPLVLISPWLQGNYTRLHETLQYYDYFDNAARYIGRSERFGPEWGRALIDSLWEYIPRRLVENKPFVYGNIVVNEHFFPGAAREGYTPGWLPWIALHRDFGAVGILLGASLWGFATKALYEYFLRYRTFLGYICYLQVAFIPVLKLAPALYFCLLVLGLAISQRLFLVCGHLLLTHHRSLCNSS